MLILMLLSDFYLVVYIITFLVQWLGLPCMLKNICLRTNAYYLYFYLQSELKLSGFYLLNMEFRLLNVLLSTKMF